MYQVRYVNPLDSRLGRHVNHDPQSRRYPIREDERAVTSISHPRHVPYFDQGNLGSCVPNAGLGCLGTGLFHALFLAMAAHPYTLDEPGAVEAYRDVTRADPFPGAWEPDDTGSDGLSLAKLFLRLGLIAGYEHAFTLAQGLAGLMKRPQITGVNWYDGMDRPDGESIVHPTGRLRGGHEVVWASHDEARGLEGFDQSWAGWTRFYIPTEEYEALLDQDGDVTSFVPLTAPAPVPEPVPGDPAGDALHAATRGWAAAFHLGSNARAANAVRRGR